MVKRTEAYDESKPMVIIEGLDSPAFTLRELMRYYKQDIEAAYFRAPEIDTPGVLNHIGYEFTFTRKELLQFLAEEALA